MKLRKLLKVVVSNNKIRVDSKNCFFYTIGNDVPLNYTRFLDSQVNYLCYDSKNEQINIVLKD